MANLIEVSDDELFSNIDNELSNTAIIISDTENDFFGTIDLPTAEDITVPMSDSEDDFFTNMPLKGARKIRGVDWKPPKDFEINFSFGLEELYKNWKAMRKNGLRMFRQI